MAWIETQRGGSSIGEPALAARCAVRPACLRAEKAGGRCSTLPTKPDRTSTARGSSGSGPPRSSGPSASSVGERQPRRISAS